MLSNKHAIKNEAGAAAILMVLIVFLMFAMAIAALDLITEKESSVNIRHKELVFLNKEQTVLSDWYTANASLIDASNSKITTEYATNQGLLNAIGIPDKYNIKVYVTNVQSYNTTSGGNSVTIDYHDFYLVIPSATYGTGTFSGNTFTPVANQLFTKVNGLNIENNLYKKSFNQLDSLNSSFVNYYYIMLQNDPLHDVSIDYWASNGCNGMRTADSTAFGCTNGNFANLNVILTAKYMQLGNPNNNNAILNPWGIPVQINNSGNIEQQGPPFSMFLASLTPWGTKLYLAITEPA
jgi:hypothetical protein